jgi:hypothetical protein
MSGGLYLNLHVLPFIATGRQWNPQNSVVRSMQSSAGSVNVHSLVLTSHFDVILKSQEQTKI